jgi:hypothetical protein
MRNRVYFTSTQSIRFDIHVVGRRQSIKEEEGSGLTLLTFNYDRRFDLSALRSPIKSELSSPRLPAASTRLVTAEASIPSASANSRLVIVIPLSPQHDHRFLHRHRSPILTRAPHLWPRQPARTFRRAQRIFNPRAVCRLVRGPVRYA